MGYHRAFCATTGVLTLLTVLSSAAPVRGQGPVPVAPPAGPEVPQRPTGTVLVPPPRPDYRQTVAAAIDRFQPLYVKRGSPKIAVYWNRQLTDRLGQWVADERLVVSTQAGAMVERQSPPGSTTTWRAGGSSEHITERQRLARDPQRSSPHEIWNWEFENGFLEPLFGAAVQIVDRATILRLTAAQAKGTGVGSVGMPDAQTLEVNALQGYADLLIEVLVSASPYGTHGYEMNVVAKNVKTGVLMAHVNSRSLPTPPPAGEYVATPRGFELKQRPPELRRVASDLALGVMDALANYWRRTGGGT